MHVRNQDGTSDATGLQTLHDVVARRGAEWPLVFTPDQLNRMALNTGGDLRDFFLFLRTCLIKAGATGAALPVSDAIVASAEDELRRGIVSLIPEDDRAWLRKIAASKKPELVSNDRPSHLARFFDTHLVLNYRNGHDRYDVHPLLAASLADA